MKYMYILLYLSSFLFAETDSRLLSTSEKLWVKEHPIIYVAASSEDIPFDFIDDNGKHAGMSSDYLNLVSKRTGLKFELRTAKKWDEIVSMLEEGKSDLIPYMSYSKERAKAFHFTSAYTRIGEYFFTQKGVPKMLSMEAIRDKRLVVIKGHQIVAWLQQNYPSIKFETKISAFECLQAVSKAQADVYINDRSSSLYVLEQTGMSNVKINAKVEERGRIDIHMAVRKDYEVLSDIISKVLKAVSKEQRFEILSKWRNSEGRRIQVDGAFGFGRAPFMYDESSSMGLEYSIVQKAFALSGYKIRDTEQMPTQRGQIALKNDESLEFSAGVIKDDQKGVYYSDPIIQYSNVAVTRKKDNIKIEKIGDLKGYRVSSWNGFYKAYEKVLGELANPELESSKHREFLDQEDGIHAFFFDEFDVLIADPRIYNFYKTRYVKENNLEEQEYEVHPFFDKKVDFRVAFRDEQMRDDFNLGLSEYKKTKEYEKLVEDYLNIDLSFQIKRVKVMASIASIYLFENDLKSLYKAFKPFERAHLITGIEILDIGSKNTQFYLEKRKGSFIKVSKPNFDTKVSLRTPIYHQSSRVPLHVGDLRVYYKIEAAEELRLAYFPRLEHFKGLRPHYHKHIQDVYREFDLSGEALALSTEEVLWIREHKDISIGVDPTWLPNEGFDEKNQYIGIVADYLKKIEERTGLNFHPVQTKSWQDTLKLVESQSVQMVSSPIENGSIKLWYKPSDSYLKNSLAIVMDEKTGFVSSLKQLKGKKIVIPRGAGNTQTVLDRYPDLDFTLSNSTAEAISGVSLHKFDAAIVSFNVASYSISVGGYSTLKIVGKLEESSNMALFVQKGNPILSSIINKALASITQEEQDSIVEKWIQQKYVEKTDYTLVYRIIGLSLFLLLLFYFWVRKLNKEISARQVAEDALADQLQYQKTLLEVMPNPVFTKNAKGIFTDCNAAFEKAFGLSREYVVGKTIIEIDYLPMQGRKSFHEKDNIIMQTRLDDTVETKLPYQDGSVHDVIFQRNVFFQADGSVGGLLGVMTDISELKHIQDELQTRNQMIQDSIEYASMIQQTLVPEKEQLKEYFKDFFAVWKPRDVVGGDIYFMEKLRHEDEYLIMMIDCTGHGVPGAFVTMLVKALQTNIVGHLKTVDEKISPARILKSFNRNMKMLLKQEQKGGVSNAGFDAGILYINKKEKIIRFAGAEIPLYYILNDELKMIKGDRHSVGYTSSDRDYEFKEHELTVEEGLQLFLTTDGYVDQNGGDKGFSFGKKRFKAILEETAALSMKEVEVTLMRRLESYQDDHETNDDITLMGIKL